MDEVTISIGEGEELALQMAYLMGRNDCANGSRTDGSDLTRRVLQELRKAATQEPQT